MLNSLILEVTEELIPVRNAVGQPLSSFFGYNVIGYFSSDADVASHATQQGAGVGRFKYEDIDGDGEITPDDRTFLGSPVPDYTLGANLRLNYKNFSLGMLWYGSFGAEIWNQQKWFTDFFGTFEGSGKGVRAKESWTPELGDNAKAPIWESVSNLSTSGAENSWYMEDGSYLRLRQVSLTYEISNSGFISDLGLSTLRVGFAANNLLTITDYQGLDPEVGGDVDTRFGVDVGNYPVARGFQVSLGVGF